MISLRLGFSCGRGTTWDLSPLDAKQQQQQEQGTVEKSHATHQAASQTFYALLLQRNIDTSFFQMLPEVHLGQGWKMLKKNSPQA